MQRGLVLDLIVTLLLLAFTVRGWKRRSVREAFALAGLLVGVIVAQFLVGPLTAAFGMATQMNEIARQLIALATVLVIAEAIIGHMGRRTSREVDIPGPRWLDRAGGIVMAIMRAVLVSALLLYGILGLSAANPDSPGFAQGVNESASGRILADETAPFSDLLDFALARSGTMRELTVAVREQTFLRVTVPEEGLRFDGVSEPLDVEPSAERRLFELLNEERERAGLHRLVWCEACARVARGHSLDMYREGFFSHIDPEGRDPVDRLRAAAVDFTAAGENLAIAPSAEEAHAGFMTSTEHKVNVLRAAFEQVGIGIYDGPYGLVCTQVFRTP